MIPQDLTRISWPQVRGSLVLIPLGSCEQHGPHLPLDVDTYVARAVSTRWAAQHEGAVLGPALEYGASGEHEGFPGTLSMGTDAMTEVLVELGRSASRWASRMLIVNGHGGNADALTAAGRRLRAEGRDAAWWSCSVAGGDAHAGRTETSLMLALRGDVVQRDQLAPGRLEPIATLLPTLRRDGLLGVTASGVLGDPTQATAEEGDRLISGLVGRLHDDVAAWRVAEDGRLGPAT